MTRSSKKWSTGWAVLALSLSAQTARAADAEAPACDGAAGSWRGTGGDLAGRDGTLVVSRQDDGLVRVVLGP